MDSRITDILDSVITTRQFGKFLEEDLRHEEEVALLYNVDTEEFSQVIIGEMMKSKIRFNKIDAYNGNNNALVFHTHPEFMGDNVLSESDILMAREQAGICALSKEMFELEWDGKIHLADGTEADFRITGSGEGSGPSRDRYLDSVSLQLE